MKRVLYEVCNEVQYKFCRVYEVLETLILVYINEFIGTIFDGR
jgi:hypothetical protein